MKQSNHYVEFHVEPYVRELAFHVEHGTQVVAVSYRTNQKDAYGIFIASVFFMSSSTISGKY
ncbi:hypothetical protein LACPH_002804 [Lacticaseibacillus parahuelsenbergensis]|uniref:Uncharacterized protein n=2 Tax=Lacticaseibacillus TaxID=2759736 RepID=A0ABY9L3F1_9LACO|nr:hypothetical protein [Lacticaseibacillus sp. NCIMB 15471]WLV78018.1 hypothetical protein LACPH_002804 [Lacticaseibacillus sp. NCIMB 15471]